MRIAMFSWEALEGLPVGGGAVYASSLARAMAAQGHYVRLFTRLGGGQTMEDVVRGVRVRRCHWDARRTFIDEIHALCSSFATHYADTVSAEGPYDVVHCHEWFTIGAGLRALASDGRTRLCVSFHSTEWGRTGRWPETGDSAVIANIERRGVERADAVVAASNWARRTVADQFHPPEWKCDVVYHGCELTPLEDPRETMRRARDAIGVPQDAPLLLFAGGYSVAGGGDLAADACRLAAQKYPNALFLFVGSGGMEAQMRLRAGPNAVFLPPRGRGVPVEYYHAADLVIAPLRRDHHGRAVLPAWAAAKPVAVLQGSVGAEFVLPGANGWVVADDAAALGEVISDAFGDRRKTEWMGRNGRVAAETAFGWDQAAQKLLGVYGRRGRLEKMIQ